MEIITVSEILGATKGRLLSGGMDAEFSRISTDTRTIGKGSMFLALKGKKYDAHKFISRAVKKRAGGVIVSSQSGVRPAKGLVVIKVKDTLRALQDTAAFYRRKFKIPVVAVTGSNGKTTTKEIIWNITSLKFPVLKSRGNYNNEIGLPLSLLELNRTHRAAVLEFATNAPGEIRRLAEIGVPDIGVITNIGMSHTEGLCSIGGVAKEKFSLLQGLSKKGSAVLNADDESTGKRIAGLKKIRNIRLLTYGIEKKSDVYASDIACTVRGGSCFKIHLPCRRPFRVRSPLMGMHNVYNVLAASAAAHILGASESNIKRGIEKVCALPMRMQIENVRGLKLVNDAYNANPQSVRALLKFSRELKTGRKIFVFGDMKELGKWSAPAHCDIGRDMYESGIEILFAIGRMAGLAADKFGEMGGISFVFQDKKKLIRKLLAETKKSDVVLVKGSRTAGMDEIARAIKKNYRGT